jgi:hypothetical protein
MIPFETSDKDGILNFEQDQTAPPHVDKVSNPIIPD